ncbi:Ig-like domain-containing protein, partial [Photobacterium sanguinicancri]|uniref:Ig-like domain-containing protein n=1 Tax=Photobacterium sanguinicancri TaxID=875932 RepID=UPI0026E42A36
MKTNLIYKSLISAALAVSFSPGVHANYSESVVQASCIETVDNCSLPSPHRNNLTQYHEITVPFATFPIDASARSELVSGELFLGGHFIELGIGKYGDFGTTNIKPSEFWGTTNRSTIGMSVDLDGFGNAEPYTMDFFLPGSPEERFYVGIEEEDGKKTVASNITVGSQEQMPTEVEDTSDVAANELGAKISSELPGKIEVTQEVSFNAADKFFRTKVTLKNISSKTIDRTRYVRAFDPDNTVDQGGAYVTRNVIEQHHASYDGKEVVRAKTISDTDPIYRATGSRAPIFFYSKDPDVRVTISKDWTPDIMGSALWDSPYPKNHSIDEDALITLTYQATDLEPNESVDFIYYTSMDDRVFHEVEDDIIDDDAKRTGIKVLSDYVATPINTSITYDVTANDVDNDGDDLSVIAASFADGYTGHLEFINGEITYTPPADYEGVSIVNYTVSDGNGNSNYSTFTIAVGDANLAPVAKEDFASTYPDEEVLVDVLSNDTDVNGDELIITSASASSGAVVISDGKLAYTPRNRFLGFDTISYQISDQRGGVSNSFLTVEVASNFKPVANNDSVVVGTGEKHLINVLNNDTDVDDNIDPKSVEIIIAPKFGAVEIEPDTGNVTYTSNSGYLGEDQFSYTVNDTEGLVSNIASVDINVVPFVNTAPEISGTPDTSVYQNSEYSFISVANDIDGDDLTFSITNKPTWAEFNTSTGALTGTPTN